MKTLYYLVFLSVFFVRTASSQNVGIGTSTPSGKIDITASDEGILIPRVSLTSKNASAPLTAPTTSELVYNTATSGTIPNNVTPGYYYWDGTEWIRLKDGETWREYTLDVASKDVNDRIYHRGQVIVGFNRTDGFNGIAETDFDASADARLYVKGNIVLGDEPDTDPTSGGGIGNFGIKFNGWRSWWNGDKIAAKIMTDFTSSPGCGDTRVTDLVFSLDPGTRSCGQETDDPAEEAMRIKYDGRVGIGTNAPQARLHVSNYSPNTGVSNGGAGRAYFNGGSTGIAQDAGAHGSGDLSIYGEGAIITNTWFQAFNGTVTFSDRRIKNIIGLSNNTKDLTTLSAIEIVDYTHKDQVKNGDRVTKKVIAQQVEKVFPNAITEGTAFIPNIYEICDAIDFAASKATLTLNTIHGLEKGNLVKIILTDGKEMITEVVTTNGEYTFTINWEAAPCSKIFVYGKQVHDFKMVDYDALSMLNISATQELIKTIGELEFELEMVKKNTIQEADFKDLKAEVDYLKDALLQMGQK